MDTADDIIKLTDQNKSILRKSVTLQPVVFPRGFVDTSKVQCLTSVKAFEAARKKLCVDRCRRLENERENAAQR